MTLEEVRKEAKRLALPVRGLEAVLTNTDDGELEWAEQRAADELIQIAERLETL